MAEKKSDEKAILELAAAPSVGNIIAALSTTSVAATATKSSSYTVCEIVSALNSSKAASEVGSTSEADSLSNSDKVTVAASSITDAASAPSGSNPPVSSNSNVSEIVSCLKAGKTAQPFSSVILPTSSSSYASLAVKPSKTDTSNVSDIVSALNSSKTGTAYANTTLSSQTSNSKTSSSSYVNGAYHNSSSKKATSPSSQYVSTAISNLSSRKVGLPSSSEYVSMAISHLTKSASSTNLDSSMSSKGPPSFSSGTSGASPTPTPRKAAASSIYVSTVLSDLKFTQAAESSSSNGSASVTASNSVESIGKSSLSTSKAGIPTSSSINKLVSFPSDTDDDNPVPKPRHKRKTTHSAAITGPQLFELKEKLDRKTIFGSPYSESHRGKTPFSELRKVMDSLPPQLTSKVTPGPAPLSTITTTSTITPTTTITSTAPTTVTSTTPMTSTTTPPPTIIPTTVTSATTPMTSASTTTTPLPTTPAKIPKRKAPSKLSAKTTSATKSRFNFKRLSSRKCREEWNLPTRFHPSPSKSSAQREGQVSTAAPMSLPHFVADYCNQFPVTISVIEGLSKEQLASKIILNVHFLKKTKVLDISDSANQRYVIPYSSLIKVGIVYCPGVKNETYYFDKVSDIIQADDLPKVVTCTKKIKDKKITLSQDEVLIPIEIISEISKKPKLRVFSVTCTSEKILTGDICGRFTTDPQKATFFIPDIIECIPNPFPMSARLYLDKGTNIKLPDSLTKNPVTLLSSNLEESIIVTQTETTGLSTDSADKGLIEIPNVPDITVAIVSRDQKEMLSDSKYLWKTLIFSPDKTVISPWVSIDGKHTIQHKLLTMVREGEERKYSAIETPPVLRKDIPLLSTIDDGNAYQVLIDGMARTSTHTSLSSSNSSGTYMSTTSSTADEVDMAGRDDVFYSTVPDNPVEKKQQRQCASTDVSTNRLVRRIEAVESKVSAAAEHNIVSRLTRRVEALEYKKNVDDSPPKTVENRSSVKEKSEIEDLKMSLKTLWAAFRVLQEDVQQLRGEVKASQSAAKEDNITALKKLDTNDVLNLLGALKLDQYKDVFAAETITGEILAECTETVLRDDMEMRNPEHRSVLMEVVKGEQPIQPLLDSLPNSRKKD